MATITRTSKKTTPKAAPKREPASKPVSAAKRAKALAAKEREVTEALEALSATLLEAAMFMPDGYVPLTGTAEYTELTEVERADALQASYFYWQRDPLAGRAIQLIRDYTFGRGLAWKAKDSRVTAVLKKFFADKSNRIITRAAGQWELIERAQLAGEVFLAFFVNRLTGHVKVRIIEPGEITQIISDAEDKDTILFYERKWSKRAFSWSSKAYEAGGSLVTDYLPDWTVVPPRNDREMQTARLDNATVGDAGTYICVHHLKINSHGPRGVPLLLRVLSWLKAYKGFMEDRATLTLAAATFAFKQKIKGSAAAVARLQQQWSSFDSTRRYGTGGKERREGAQTLIENENVSLEQFQVNTNAGNAYQDGRMLRQQVGTGVGITEQNLTGDPSVANLASATQMEGPMLKMFESWQQLFHDEIVDILDFVVAMAVQYGELHDMADLDRSIEVDFPPIVTQDLATFINAVAALISAQAAAGQEFIAAKRLARYILQAFGENDIDAALSEVDWTKRPAPAPAAVTTPAAPTATPPADAPATALKAAIEGLRAAMQARETELETA